MWFSKTYWKVELLYLPKWSLYSLTKPYTIFLMATFNVFLWYFFSWMNVTFIQSKNLCTMNQTVFENFTKNNIYKKLLLEPNQTLRPSSSFKVSFTLASLFQIIWSMKEIMRVWEIPSPPCLCLFRWHHMECKHAWRMYMKMYIKYQ